jgi:hypothetical protein
MYFFFQARKKCTDGFAECVQQYRAYLVFTELREKNTVCERKILQLAQVFQSM